MPGLLTGNLAYNSNALSFPVSLFISLLKSVIQGDVVLTPGAAAAGSQSNRSAYSGAEVDSNCRLY